MRRFLRDQRGNIALMTAMMILPMVGLMGGGVDLIRYTRAQTQLCQALESGVLAAASLTNVAEPKDVVIDYTTTNVLSTTYKKDPAIEVYLDDVKLNRRVIRASAEATIDSTFLKLFSIDDLEVSCTSTATQGASDTEVAIVLDISTSMNGDKIDRLREASEEFVRTMLEDDAFNTTSLSIVPFSGTVSIGEDLYDDLVVSEASAYVVNPNKSQYEKLEDNPTRSFRFTSTDTGTGPYYVGMQNCIELWDSDFDDLSLIPNGSRGQIPPFWRSRKYLPFCPLEHNEAMFNTRNLSDAVDKVQNLTTIGGTGLNHGTLWGVKALSPAWKGKFGGDFPDRPKDFDPEVFKALVIMADGDMDSQRRPEDPTRFHSNESHWSNNTPNEADIWERPVVSAWKRRKNYEQYPTAKGKVSDNPSQKTAYAQTKRICNAAKEEGIVIYTIGFQVPEGGDAEELLKYCASADSFYFPVQDLEIDKAFEAIASSVNALRLIG